jgi:hypothetical protein
MRRHLTLRLQAIVDQDLQHLQMMVARTIPDPVQAVALVAVIQDRQDPAHQVAAAVVVVAVVVEAPHIVTCQDIHLVLI